MIGLHSLHIKPALLHTIGTIDEFKGLWNGLDDHTTGLNLLGDVAAHGGQLKAMMEPLKARDLTPEIVQALHKTLIGGDEGGQIRTDALQLDITHDGQSAGTLDTAAPEDIAPLLHKLLGWVNETLDDAAFHPLLIIAVFTAIFLQISPFKQGNIRLARFLILLLMLKAGYRYAVFAPLEDAFNAHAQTLYVALSAHQASLEAGQPDWQPWLTCFFAILLQHQDLLALQINSGVQTDAIAAMPALSIALLDVLQNHKRATMKQLIDETKGRRSTIKLRMGELVKAGLVKRHGAGRGVWYSLI